MYKFYDKDSNNEINCLVFCDTVIYLGYVSKDSD